METTVAIFRNRVPLAMVGLSGVKGVYETAEIPERILRQGVGTRY